jgi:hypothetical protein
MSIVRFAFALLLTSAVCRAAAVLDAFDATWVGRTLPIRGNVSFNWEGVQASFSITNATRVTLLVSSSSPMGLRPCEYAFHTLVDGAIWLNWTITQQSSPVSLTIAEGLSSQSPHTVAVWYISQPLCAHQTWEPTPWSHSFHSFSTDGAFGAPLPKPLRRLQIIGDSITAGDAIDPVTCANDHLGSFGARLCQHFAVDCQTLAIGGKGIYENCCDGYETMTTLFARTIVGFPELLWDDSRFVPDGVIVALGTNDQGHNTGPAWQANFTATYAAFLQRLTRIHNNSNLAIFCAVGPITNDYYPWVAAAIAQSGVKNAHLLNFSAPVDRCGHPPWASHDIMAQQAEPLLASVLGW